MTTDTENQAIIYQPYIRIWGALLVLTGATLLSSTLHLGKMGIWIALTIASVKGGLVVFHFMHLKEEQPLFKVMLLVAFILLTIFISITLFDTAFR